MVRCLSLLGMACAALCVAHGHTQDRTPPNIVILYTDDVGYGDLGCYGARAVATPNLDRLAARSLRFTDAHCTSATCTPSRYSLSGALSLRIGNWKFVRANQGAAFAKSVGIELGNAPEPQLYDLESDLGERNNLAAKEPQRATAMAK